MIITQEQTFGKTLAKHVQELERFLQQSQERGARLDEVERGLLKRLWSLGHASLKEYTQRAGDGDDGATLKHEGRTVRRSRRKHPKMYRSIFGPLAIRRYVYSVREKQKVVRAPLDERLGLPQGEASYVLEEWVGRLTAHLSYAQAVAWLEEWLGVPVTVRGAEKIVEKLAAHTEGFRSRRGPPARDSEEELLVISVDGKGVPMRRSLEQRLHEEQGVRPHKRHRTRSYETAGKRRLRGQQRSRKQMAYVGVAYSLRPWPREAEHLLDEVHRKEAAADRPRPKNKRYWAELTQVREEGIDHGPTRLFRYLATEVAARNPHRTRRVICLMDGDRSFQQLQKSYLPSAVRILDIFHVMEKLWKAAYCFHPEGSAAAEVFVDRYLQMLLEGKVSCVKGVFRRFLKAVDGRKKVGLEEAVRYFETNRDAMRYDEYLAAGYPIGSGVVEGACRHVVKDRMEGTGMRWQIEGAQNLLNLRTTVLNEEWSGFIHYRIKTEQDIQYACSP